MTTSPEKIYYALWHVRALNDQYDTEEARLVGLFSSEELARQAQDKVKDAKGFRDFPDGFSIHETYLNLVSWREGFAGKALIEGLEW